ncbi:MAG: DUF262 domain-containing protein [Acidobacteria bacterium]|nr:DUF262 domain-containing protein [Acidobacteriota bacterium]
MPQRNREQRVISESEKLEAEEQIREEVKVVDYDTKEYTVELLVNKYRAGKDDDENELFIPEYQRDYVWDEKRKSKFIESVMLGLPIPYIFTAALFKEISEDEGRIEIVDGSQRIRTLDAFVHDELELLGLEKLTKLNGFKFSDLEVSRQRKFKRRPIRVIELSDKADDQIRRDIFERINTGSDELSPMEKRKGIFEGPFYDFVSECAANELFNELTPISAVRRKREEAAEMVLRYFAYADRYQDFQKSVSDFLDEFIKEKRVSFDRETMEREFVSMLNFVNRYFANGFRKNEKNRSVPRVRFEAISVGATLALRENPDLVPSDVRQWLESEEFKKHTVSDASNSRPKVMGRVEFVRDKLLGR